MLHEPDSPRPADSSADAGRAKPVAPLRTVAVIGNFPPRRCGIATFTADVVASLRDDAHCRVVAMSDGPTAYGAPVTDVIRQDVRDDYRDAALALNRDRVDVVSLQHEFGIFGGAAGEYVLDLLEALKCPVVTTLHTVLTAPDHDQRRVLSAVIRRSTRVIVMSEYGRDILIDTYHAQPDRVLVVPHGAPDRPRSDGLAAKARIGLGGRRILMTFGLLSPNKGIESVIAGLPAIVRTRPDVLYLVLGATHPHLLRREGEAYLEALKAQAVALGVQDHVRFVHRYTDQGELLEHLDAADVYVTPYRNEAQITSGTLAYAVALGKPVVSTPYWHARDLLSDGVGALAPFDDPEALTTAIVALLDDDAHRATMCERAYARGRGTIWARSADSYLAAFEAAIREQRRPPAPASVHGAAAPRPHLSAVARITDDCGIMQHGCGVVADRAHGYCLDDAARGLILAHRMHALRLGAPTVRRLAYTYAGFIQHAWNPAHAAFRNFMSYDRRWLEEEGSNDSMGRAFWSLGVAAARPVTPALGAWAQRLLRDAQPALDRIVALRAGAFAMLGVHDAAFARRVGAALQTAFHENRKPGWTWFEPTLTYDNARLPEAMLLCAAHLQDNAMRRDALSALRWLVAVQTGPGGVFQPAGNATFHAPYATPAPFDQQPLEATATVDACVQAFRATGDAFWRTEALRAHAWFYGANIHGLSLVDEDGGCHDGLTACGMNLNQGAESVLAFQMAACAVRGLDAAKAQARD
ncbi:MAG: glycosyltransferase family 4 protein [Hyphomonadaceae bacterium]|nr:glycosyltransferase family 4 protein [Hyphomonadaceae bacterium]